MTYLFGPFRADQAAYRVSKGERLLDLTPKLLDLLFYLLERPATLVTKEQLLDAVWPDANVTDNALAQAVSELREALGDSASSPTYIKTVARRGYRFIAPVDVEPAADPEQARPAARATGSQRSIAVLDFTNVTGDADVEWLSAGIAETVSSDLAGLEAFRVVDRWRVRQASLQSGGSLHDVGAALGVGFVAVGSFQRSGPRLRISARIIDVSSSEAVADARVDGLLDDVFTLQDGIVTALARELDIPSAPRGRGGHETSNLDAYRAYTEGWLKIETLDTELVGDAIGDFKRAIRADSQFAQAYAGLANAEFVAYEMTRQIREPNHDALAAGIEHAEHAIRLAPDLAEAHATLSFLLTSAARYADAQVAARHAVAIDPDSWRHQYRLGHATWGSARLRALERTIALYPQFAYARLEMAMVHVARGRLDVAEALVRQGAADQDQQRADGNRFPGLGFHWLLAALHAAQGRHDEAVAECDRELERVARRRLYGPEYAVVALYWRGHGLLALGRPDEALAAFRDIDTWITGHPRGALGEAAALSALGDAAGAAEAASRAQRAADHFAATDRPSDASLMRAIGAAGAGDAGNAIAAVQEMLSQPVWATGWTIPLEPAFHSLFASPAFGQLLAALAERAA
jgi:DNA-binding winged helix-turn-helix (wHTH) protein